MVLQGQLCGRVGHRREYNQEEPGSSQDGPGFFSLGAAFSRCGYGSATRAAQQRNSGLSPGLVAFRVEEKALATHKGGG
jgi:hypothetical protein